MLEITFEQWAHDVVSWHFSTKDSLISGPAPPHCIQMCHQAGYAPAFTQSQALMSSIQPFTFTHKKSLEVRILLMPKPQTQLPINSLWTLDTWQFDLVRCCKGATLLLLIFNLPMPLLVDPLLWGF